MRPILDQLDRGWTARVPVPTVLVQPVQYVHPSSSSCKKQRKGTPDPVQRSCTARGRTGWTGWTNPVTTGTVGVSDRTGRLSQAGQVGPAEGNRRLRLLPQSPHFRRSGGPDFEPRHADASSVCRLPESPITTGIPRQED